MAELKFDQALKNLEKIVEEMEAGELSLEDSFKKYEQGIKLAQVCLERLGRVEKKIELLQRSPEGKLITRPFSKGAEPED
jgi:exodeoxyribonuclease VII small subunit